MTSEIEQIVNSGVCTQETLRLSGGFKASHAPLPNSRWLMGKLCPVVGILGGIVNGFRNELSVCNSIASHAAGQGRAKPEVSSPR